MSQRPIRRAASDLGAVAGTATYRELIERLRRRIRESQTRATSALNTECGARSRIGGASGDDRGSTPFARLGSSLHEARVGA